MAEHTGFQQTKWHPFLAKGFELSVGTRGVQVFSEVEVGSNPPKVDILLLRRESASWTPEQLEMLPDGIRETNAKHVLIEFKYTESLTRDAILQALGYEYFYRTANGLKPSEVKMFILCAITPQAARLKEFGYRPSSVAGVIVNDYAITKHITLVLLNNLADEPYNAFVKTFASRKAQKESAFSQLKEFKNLSVESLAYFETLRIIWSLPEGANMNELLTPEKVMEIAEERGKILIQNLPFETLSRLIGPEFKQGFIKQGISQKTRDIVLAMHAEKFDIEVIANITSLTIAQVQEWLDENEVTDDDEVDLS